MSGTTATITTFATDVTSILPIVTGAMDAIGQEFISNPVLEIGLGCVLAGVGYKFVMRAVKAAKHA
jgi:hypothetical protein